MKSACCSSSSLFSPERAGRVLIAFTQLSPVGALISRRRLFHGSWRGFGRRLLSRRSDFPARRGRGNTRTCTATPASRRGREKVEGVAFYDFRLGRRLNGSRTATRVGSKSDTLPVPTVSPGSSAVAAIIRSELSFSRAAPSAPHRPPVRRSKERIHSPYSTRTLSTHPL